MTAVDVQKFSFAYHRGVPVLQAVTFRVEEGERVALVGPNGAGKTTLLLAIAGLLKGEGRIRVWGLEQPRDFQTLRKRIGFLFQDPEDQLFFPWVYDEVAAEVQKHVGQPASQDAVWALLAEVGLAEKARASVSSLSPGEKKRLALATLLVRRPRLWLLDEPSAGLDPGMRRTLIHWIQTLPGTLILATHDLDLALVTCQRVLLLDRGEIIAEGPALEILSNEELLERHGLTLPLTLQGVRNGQGSV